MRPQSYRFLDASAQVAQSKLERLVGRLANDRAQPRAMIYRAYRTGLLGAASQMEMFWERWKATAELRELPPGIDAEIERILLHTVRCTELLIRRSQEAEKIHDDERRLTDRLRRAPASSDGARQC